MTFEYSLDDKSYYKNRLGLIVLESDETIEQEFRYILDDTTSIYHSRIHCDKVVTKDNLKKNGRAASGFSKSLTKHFL